MPVWLITGLIKFFTNKYVMIAISVGLLVGGAYLKGRTDAGANCREAQKQAEIDTLKRDMDAWKAADDVELILQKQMESERDDLQDKVRKYATELQSKADARCTLDDGDIRALDGVRGNGKR